MRARVQHPRDLGAPSHTPRGRYVTRLEAIGCFLAAGVALALSPAVIAWIARRKP